MSSGFNVRLNAGVATFFMAAVVPVVAASVREWVLILSSRKKPALAESPVQLRPAGAG